MGVGPKGVGPRNLGAPKAMAKQTGFEGLGAKVAGLILGNQETETYTKTKTDKPKVKVKPTGKRMIQEKLKNEENTGIKELYKKQPVSPEKQREEKKRKKYNY